MSQFQNYRINQVLIRFDPVQEKLRSNQLFYKIYFINCSLCFVFRFCFFLNKFFSLVNINQRTILKKVVKFGALAHQYNREEMLENLRIFFRFNSIRSKATKNGCKILNILRGGVFHQNLCYSNEFYKITDNSKFVNI